MIYTIEELQPIRWKVFQYLLIDRENNLHDVRPLIITDE